MKIFDVEHLLLEAGQALGPAGARQALLVAEQEIVEMVRSIPTLQTKWSGSYLQKYVALVKPPSTKWEYPLKGKCINWQKMNGREVTLNSVSETEGIKALIIDVKVPELWWWKSKYGDDASVLFAVQGDEEPHKMRLSEFVTLVKNIVTPII
jgi:hypothetical protein